MKRRFLPSTGLALLALLAGCDGKRVDGPVAVSVIGQAPAVVDPIRKAISPPGAVLLAAVAQGLVRFDGAGQIEPGLAIRWDVSDDGLYYTFRLADRAALDAEEAARRLRAAIAPASRNPLKPLLGAVDEIVAVTPEVVEIRLAAPQPNLLELLAQPEMALLDGDAGTGPLAIAARGNPVLTLAPILQPDEEIDPSGQGNREITLRGERAGLAVARFKEGRAAIVLGGTFADLAIARAADLPARVLRFDPVAGLFGLAVVSPTGFLGAAENRRALAMSIDRDRIAAAFPNSGWRTSITLVPPGTSELGAPGRLEWADLSPELRHRVSSGIVRLWTERNGPVPRLRLAMPEGPGGRLLFQLLAAGWRAIGIEAERVASDADADLRLIDMVAPSDSAAWYLHRFSCGANPVCDREADIAFKSAMAAATAEDRTGWLAEAETEFAKAMPFLPIAQPLRWSLVAPRLEGFRENPRGVHPIHHLLPAER